MTLLANLFDPVRARSRPMRALAAPLYSWSLSGGGTPDRLVVLPPDPWGGDAGRGRWVANRMLDFHGQQLPLDARAFGSHASVNEQAMRAVHGFEWLRDLQCVGGDQTRRLGRQMMQDWMSVNTHWRATVWDFAVTATRLSSWLRGYDFFCASGDDAFLEQFYASLIKQIRHLERAEVEQLTGLEALSVVRALVFAGLALENGQARLDDALGWLEQWLAHELDDDGMHISRSPHQAVLVARQLIDMRASLVRGNVPAPTHLQAGIDRIMHAIRFFRVGDQKLACFHGTQEDEVAALDSLFRVSAVRIRKAPTQLRRAGFESLNRERVGVILDCGHSAPHPYEVAAHASPLAFEMCVGRDRMIVNCGTHPGDHVWADHLRATAAHSGLTIDDRNAFEIRPDGHFGRTASHVKTERTMTQDGIMVTASHDGYAPLNGFVHTRRMTLSNDGRILEGEDFLASDAALTCAPQFTMRFHLHPRVQTSLIQDGNAALLRLPSGGGWRFSKAGATLSLEPSIYCGVGMTPRKTQQLVLSGVTEAGQTQVSWRFSDEA